jgi:hypothetical protein
MTGFYFDFWIASFLAMTTSPPALSTREGAVIARRNDEAIRKNNNLSAL